MQNAKSTRRLSFITIVLAVITIIFAGLSIYYQIDDKKFDEGWNKHQIESNNEIINELEDLNKTLKTIIDSRIIQSDSTNEITSKVH